MTTGGKPGRPRLTDDAAWLSVRRRFHAKLKEVKGKDCHVYTGPRVLEFAGERGSISPINFVIAEMGHDLRIEGLSYRSCGTTGCVWPDHLIVAKYAEPRTDASWTPEVLPSQDAGV